MPRHQRDPKLEQFWRRHLGRQAGSGLTVRDYCCQHGLRESSFYSWRRVIGERDRRVEPVAPATPAFLPIAVVDSPTPPDVPTLEIQLGHGRCVRVRNGCDRRLLAEVLTLLQNSSAPEDRPC
jgi:hypothetical protein